MSDLERPCALKDRVGCPAPGAQEVVVGGDDGLQTVYVCAEHWDWMLAEMRKMGYDPHV